MLLFGPALLAYLAALLDPTLREALVPAEMRRTMEGGRTWTDIEPDLRPGMATLIFTNNIQVAFFAFAGGVLFGLGTVYVLVSNGLMLGSALGAAQFYGVAPLLLVVHLAARLPGADVHRDRRRGGPDARRRAATTRPAAAPRSAGARRPARGRAGCWARRRCWSSPG